MIGQLKKKDKDKKSTKVKQVVDINSSRFDSYFQFTWNLVEFVLKEKHMCYTFGFNC